MAIKHRYQYLLCGILLSEIGIQTIQLRQLQHAIHQHHRFPTASLARAALPAPPADPPPPPNQRTPGGGLNSFKQDCSSSSNLPLTALIPVDQHTLSAVDTPTLLFYIPDRPENIVRGEFSLSTSDEKQRLYQLKFTLPQTPGIVSIRLPKLPQYDLKPGQLYRWYFKLECRSTSDTTPNLDINGWIQRAANPSATQQQADTTTPLIWYDTIATLAAQRQAAPENPDLKQRWQQLLTSIDLEHLATAPFVGPVRPLKP